MRVCHLCSQRLSGVFVACLLVKNVFGLHGHSGSALFDMNQWSPEAYMAAYERDVREYHGRRATRRPCAPDCETGK
jgi:hypothetical protein